MTGRPYDLDLARFSDFLDRRAAVAACDKAVIHNYVRHLFDVRSLKESSVKRHLATLRSFFRWLEDEGDAVDDPFRGARIRIRMPKRLPRVIGRSDLRRLLLHDRPHSFADLTAYVATELLFATGMRVSELATLLDAAVDVEEGTITIIGKGNRQRRVFVPEELKSLLRDYRTARDRCASTADTYLVNSRGDAASPQMIRRLVRLHGERSAVRDRVTPTCSATRWPPPPRPPHHLDDRDLHARRRCGTESADYGEASAEGDRSAPRKHIATHSRCTIKVNESAIDGDLAGGGRRGVSSSRRSLASRTKILYL